jgi:hypothetical protein
MDGFVLGRHQPTLQHDHARLEKLAADEPPKERG